MKYLFWSGSLFLMIVSFLYFSYENQFLIHKAISASMEPTIMTGDWVFQTPVFISYKPKIGDIVDFQCLTEECTNKHLGIGVAIHRITSIDPNGCMKIVGDNPKYSQSWEKLPCYMPDEIEIDGVVHKLPF